jgi:alcohol dehydrogenase class IV
MITKPTHVKAQELTETIHRIHLKAPQTIVFGRGKLNELGKLVMPPAWGQKAILVTGKQSAAASGALGAIQVLLTRYGVQLVPFADVSREPTVAMVDAGAKLARDVKPKLVVSVGGGSVIDCAKAIAALAVNEGSVEDYLEGVGRGLPVAHTPVPHIAIPTVAGTGAEMTKNAVIVSLEKGYKKSMRADSMVPTIALIDPLLAVTVPPSITAAGGMDAITQLFEPCVTLKRRPETTMLALEGLRIARAALMKSYEEGGNVLAREQMALVSMLGGVCLANSGLGMAHGIAAGLGALFDMTHGLACGILLPHAIRYNRAACANELSQAITAFLNQPRASVNAIDEGIAVINELNNRLCIPQDLKHLQLKEEDLKRVAKASMGSSMSGNPVPMTEESVLEFLKTIA